MYEWISLKLGGRMAGFHREDGQGPTEYALVLGTVTVALVATISLLGTSITDFLGEVAGEVASLP